MSQRRRITDRANKDWPDKKVNTLIECRLLATAPESEIIMRPGTDDVMWDATRKMTWKRVMAILQETGVVKPNPDKVNSWIKMTNAFNTADGQEAYDINSVVKSYLAEISHKLDLTVDDDLREYLNIKLIEIVKVFERAGQIDLSFIELIPALAEALIPVIRKNIPIKTDPELTEALISHEIVTTLSDSVSLGKVTNSNLIQGFAIFASRNLTNAAYNHPSFQQKSSKTA